MAILQTGGLSKHYGRVQALSDFSLSVESGQIMGILGPNGSGKTTTLSILLGVLIADKGDYHWFDGMQGAEARRHIGALLETPNFYPYLNLEDNLKICCDIKGVSYDDIPRVLQLVELEKRASSRFSAMSYGMKQRLALASVLLGDPKVMVLDEPTNGLDPAGIAWVRNLIMQVAENKTIILASHMLDEVEKVCSHVAILKQGKLLASGPVGELLGSHMLADIKADDMAALKNAVEGIKEVTINKDSVDMLQLNLADGYSGSDLNHALFKKGVTLNHLHVHKQDLETEFLELTADA